MGDLQLLKASYEFIKANPELHDQSDWIDFKYDENYELCGTTMCLAGHAAVQWGAEYPKDRAAWRLDKNGKLTEKDEYGRRLTGAFVEDFAADKLGLTPEEVSFLFYCTNNDAFPGRIEHIIELWENGQTYDGYSYNFREEYDEDGYEYDDEDFMS